MTPLNGKEMRLIQMVYNGVGYKEIAEAENLSLSGVKHRATLLYKKIGVRGKFQAIEWYYKNFVMRK